MGDDVVDHHYVRVATFEQEEFDRIVADYEIARGFERAWQHLSRQNISLKEGNYYATRWELVISNLYPLWRRAHLGDRECV